MKIKYLVGIMVLYYGCFLSQNIFIARDSAMYLALAGSLAGSGRYLDLYLPQASPHALYPPGYPILLALVSLIFGSGVFFARFLSLALSAVALFLLIRILPGYLTKKETVIAFLLFSLNPLFVHFTHSIASEPAYLVFSLSALLLLDKTNLYSTRRTLLALLFIVAAVYTRLAGIALYIGAIAYFWKRKQYHGLFLAGVAGLLILPWLFYSFGSDLSYSRIFMMKDVFNDFGLSCEKITILDLSHRVFSNFKYYSAKVAADLVFFPFFKTTTLGNFGLVFKVVLSLVFSVLFSLGFFIRVKKNGFRLPEVYCVVYIIILIFWPYHAQHLLIPIYPFLLAYLFLCLRQRPILILRLWIVAGLLLVVLAGNLQSVVSLLVKRKNIRQEALLAAYAWLNANTGEDALVMSRDPAGLYFYSGRKGYLFDKTKIGRVDYVLAEEGDGPGAGGAIEVYHSIERPAVNIYKTVPY